MPDESNFSPRIILFGLEKNIFSKPASPVNLCIYWLQKVTNFNLGILFHFVFKIHKSKKIRLNFCSDHVVAYALTIESGQKLWLTYII